MKNHVGRALDLLHELGWMADRVERRAGRIAVDWCGFADVLAVCQTESGCLGLQVTSPSNVAARVSKLERLASVERFLRYGNRVEVWGVPDGDVDPETVVGRSLVLVGDDLTVLQCSCVLDAWREAVQRGEYVS